MGESGFREQKCGEEKRLKKKKCWRELDINVSSLGKYTHEEGQQTRLPESTCDIVNRFKIYL